MPNQSPQVNSPHTEQHTPADSSHLPGSEYLQEIARLHEQLQAMQQQQARLEQELEAQNRTPSKPNDTLAQRDASGRYSFLVNMAFQVASWLFLFVMGFAIALMVSAALNAPGVVNALLELLKLCLPSLVVLTLCVIAATAILESLK